MAIEVRAGSTTHTFADAKTCNAQNGHLFVYNASNETLAIFAPEKWDNFVVVDAVETKRAKSTIM